MFAAGELAMTAHDVALWDISLMQRTILKPESYNQMFTEVKLKDGKGTHYGLGVQIMERDGHHSIEHSGEVNGFVSDNEVLIDDGIAVAVLTNHMAGGAEQITRLAAATVAGVQHTPNEDQAIAIYNGLQQGQIDRSLLAPNLNAYFDAQTLSPTIAISLAPLGDPLTFQPNRRTTPRRHDVPCLPHPVPDAASEPHDLHLPRRQTRAISDRARRLIFQAFYDARTGPAFHFAYAATRETDEAAKIHVHDLFTLSSAPAGPCS